MWITTIQAAYYEVSVMLTLDSVKSSELASFSFLITHFQG